MPKDDVMIVSILVTALIGFCISLYIYLLEKKVKANPQYKPLCDLSDKISCTKPMKSAYASIFYFSNAIVALIFYSSVALLALIDAKTMLIFFRELLVVYHVY